MGAGRGSGLGFKGGVRVPGIGRELEFRVCPVRGIGISGEFRLSPVQGLGLSREFRLFSV